MASEIDALRQIRRRAAALAGILAGVLLYGVIGYRLIGGGGASWINCLYMTSITVTTIGFGEILPAFETQAARLFTLTLAFLGVGIFTYTVSSVTFFATDEGLRAHWRRQRMEKKIRDWTGHYLIGGWNVTAAQIAAELQMTGRRHLIVVPPDATLPVPPETPDQVILEGEPTDEEALKHAGIERAAGFFAAEPDDAANIVACLTVRQLNPALRVVAAVNDPRNSEKMRRAGANAVVASTAIGALRMASEMVRPTVVSFLDTMLRGTAPVLRIEEVTPAARFRGTALGELMSPFSRKTLLVALRSGADWVFNPPDDRALDANETLVVMTTPEDLETLHAKLAPDSKTGDT